MCPLLRHHVYSEMTIDSKSDVETRDLLRRNHGSLKMMISRARSSGEKKTASIMEGSSVDPSDSQSILSFAESSRSSTCFEFDDLVVNSKVYRQAMLRSIQKNAAGDELNSNVELDPVLTEINLEASDLGDALAPTEGQVNLNLSAHETMTMPLSPGIVEGVSSTGDALVPTERRVKPDLPEHDTVTDLSSRSISTNRFSPIEDNRTSPSSSPFLLQPLQLPELSVMSSETVERLGSFRLTETTLELPNTSIQHDEYSSQRLHPLPRAEPPRVDTSWKTQLTVSYVQSNLPRRMKKFGGCKRHTKGIFVRAQGQLHHIECFTCRVSVRHMKGILVRALGQLYHIECFTCRVSVSSNVCT